MNTAVVYFDVDDTLVRSAGTKRVPIPAVVERVRSLHTAGVTLYLWSSGGADYARTTAADLDISHCFAGFLPKPTHIVDDQHISQWRDLKHLHPNEEIDA
jgi:hydroxymethylpyrimidine pyrophosphatase-like HAD family hydrolase